MEPESHFLYFWDIEIHEGKLAVGHIALKVFGKNDDDDLYISFWPNEEAYFKKGQRNQKSLLDDIVAEGSRNPEVLHIPFDSLDLAKIRTWREETEKNYHLLKWNCADVVRNALQNGLTDLELKTKLENRFAQKKVMFPLTPKSLFLWVKKEFTKKPDGSVKDQQLPLPDSASGHLYPCAPLKPTANFSGRSAHLQSVCETLKSPNKTLVVAAGIGGVGKTELARKVAQELFDFFEGRVFWMDSETKDSFQKSLLILSNHLKNSHDFRSEIKLPKSNQEIQQLLHEIYAHFEAKNQKSLFIFDNANRQDFGARTNKLARYFFEICTLFFHLWALLSNLYVYFCRLPRTSFSDIVYPIFICIFLPILLILHPSLLILAPFCFGNPKKFRRLPKAATVNQFKPSSISAVRESIFLISDFLPISFPPQTFSPCPASLITSRSSDWAEFKDFQMINLQNFDLEETFEYFKNSFSEGQLKECEPEIKELHQRFDGYTLAFTLAAGWIRGSGHSQKLKEGLKCYLQLLKRASNDLHKKGKSSTSLDPNYKFDPHEIMEQTCAAIGRENPLALKLLKQMNFLSPDFISVDDCIDLHPECDRKQVDSALATLSKFSVTKILRNPDLWCLDDDIVSVLSIQIHRVIQQLVKEGQTKSKDISILFGLCDTMLKQEFEYSTPIPHLKSLVVNLEEVKASLPFWFFSTTPKCDYYIKQLRLQMENLQLNDEMTFRAVSFKLENLQPPIDPESVMDNSEFLDESDELYKITYQKLANSVLLNSMEKYDPFAYRKYRMFVVGQLESLGIRPQLDVALSWLLRNQNQDSRVALEVISNCLKNPHTTLQQRQQFRRFKLKIEIKHGPETEENAHKLLKIFQNGETLDCLRFNLTDNGKIKITEEGIYAAPFTSILDDRRKCSQFLTVIQENITTWQHFKYDQPFPFHATPFPPQPPSLSHEKI